MALLRTMSGAPVLLVGLPAAALADLFDRRRLLVAFAAWMALVSVALAVRDRDARYATKFSVALPRATT